MKTLFSHNLIKLLFCLELFSLTLGVRLSSYNIDTNSITISGISSGAAMATQYHIAFSKHVQGVGILSGVIYACAANYEIAICTEAPEQINILDILSYIRELANSGKIDDPINIRNDNVFIFHGTIDHRILPLSALQIKELYRQLGAVVKTNLTIEAAHGFPTLSYGGPCNVYSPETQFLNNCSYNVAFDTLNHLYNGSLEMPMMTVPVNDGKLVEFDQLEFGGGNSSGMDAAGFAYVPQKCQNGNEKCKLHVVFHGCQQYKGAVGDVVAKNMGYLEVAEVNGIVLVFPQNARSEINPNGCWDWFGYNDDEYLTKLGGQMQVVNKMMERVAFGDIQSNNCLSNKSYGFVSLFLVASCAYLQSFS